MVVHGFQTLGIRQWWRQLPPFVLGLHQVYPDGVVEKPRAVEVERVWSFDQHEPQSPSVELNRILHRPAQPLSPPPSFSSLLGRASLLSVLGAWEAEIW